MYHVQQLVNPDCPIVGFLAVETMAIHRSWKCICGVSVKSLWKINWWCITWKNIRVTISLILNVLKCTTHSRTVWREKLLAADTLTVITVDPKCPIVLDIDVAAFPVVAHYLRTVFLYQFRGDRLSGESRWSLSSILSGQTGLLLLYVGGMPCSDTCECQKYPTIMCLSVNTVSKTEKK